MKEVKAYRCSFCGKLYRRKKNCGKHENRCMKNPDLLPLCYGCRNIEWSSEVEKIRWRVEVRDGFGDLSGFERKMDFTPNRCAAAGYKLFRNVRLSEELVKALHDNGYRAMPLRCEGCSNYEEYKEL